MFKQIYNRFSNDIGIDLGTANTLVYLKGHGVIINEPSIVAVNQKTGQIVAIGKDAKEMWGKTPSHIKVIRPLVEGVVSDFEVTEEMLAYFLKKAESYSKKFFRPRVVIGVPSGITNVETRAVYEATINAGAREVFLIEEAMASAIGIRAPVLSTTATFVVDIGGGTTDIALIALGGIVSSLNLRVAGDHLNEKVIEYLRDEFKIFVGDQTAEAVKIALASTFEDDYEEIEVRGRDTNSGLPKGLVITDSDIREAIAYPLKVLINAIKEVLETAPPELMSDILENGIIVTGGGALLKGLTKFIESEIKLKTILPDDPLTSVARGAGIVLEEFEKYKGVLLSIDEYATS